MSTFISFFKKNEKVIKNPNEKEQINNNIDNEQNIPNNNYFSCPKCNTKLSIILNPLNLSLSYKCQNNHAESNITYNNFYNKKYINKKSNNFCQHFKIKEMKIKNFSFCNTCQMKLCSNCVLKHKTVYKHSNFIYLDNNFTSKCLKHKSDISKYCTICKSNICIFCVVEHKNHKMINYTDIISNKNNIENNNKKIEKKILKNNNIIKKLNKWQKIICSLIDELINNLNNEILINKMIINSFNSKNLD